MTARTHAAAGILAGEIAGAAMFGDGALLLPFLTVSTSLLGSLLPDIDYAGSTVSGMNRETGFVSSALNAAFGHRGILHTPFAVFGFSLLLYILSSFAGVYRWPALFGLLTGMLSHLVLDTFNPSGIMWLFPASRRHFRLARLRTGGLADRIFEKLFLTAAVVTAVILLQNRWKGGSVWQTIMIQTEQAVLI